MTKEQLQKLYNLEMITLVTGEDVLLDKIKNMTVDEAMNYLKNLEIFNHVIDNDEILNLLSDDVNDVTEVDEDNDVVNPTTKEDEDDDLPIVDDGNN